VNNVSIWAGGNFTADTPAGSYKKRTPLIVCPVVFLRTGPGALKIWQPSHRPQYTTAGPGTPPQTMGYAENVGFTDGSVLFFENKQGGVFNPMK